MKPPEYNHIKTYNKTKVNITNHLQKRATRNLEMKEGRKKNKQNTIQGELKKQTKKITDENFRDVTTQMTTEEKKNGILIIANQKNPSVSIEVKINKNKCCLC